MRRSVVLMIFFVAFVGGVYTQRVEIFELYKMMNQPTLPATVSFEEVTQTPKEEVQQEGMVEKKEEEDGGQVSEVGDPTVVEQVVTLDPEPAHEEQIEETVVEEVVEESPLPKFINLGVPFTSQAPHGNWDAPYQDACEEASVYMVHAFYEGVLPGRIPADEADSNILDIVAFEKELFGYYESTTIEQVSVLSELMFGYSGRVLEDPTMEELKTELVAGHPILIPTAGQLLGNPYFTEPGPVYHMLVLRGYTQEGFAIVNDRGTTRGEAYLYTFDDILSAMHDWNRGEEITQGRKAVLVLDP